MPPSLMTGMSKRSAARTHSMIAVICGTPAPATTRVVQIEPGPMPTLIASTPSSQRSIAPSYVATLPAMSGVVGEELLELPDGVEDAARVRVRGVDDDDVDLGVDERARAVDAVLARADGRGHAQTSEGILRGLRVAARLLDVLDGDEALEVAVLIDDQQLLDAVLVENFARLLERRADRHGDRGCPWSSARRSADRSASRSGGRGW